MSSDEITAEVRYRIDRIAIFGEKASEFKDWVPWLIDLERYLLDLENEIHDDCHSADSISELVDDETNHLKTEIEDLEQQVSDLKTDLKILQDRMERGVGHAKRCEDFIFTPEQARKQFRVIRCTK